MRPEGFLDLLGLRGESQCAVPTDLPAMPRGPRTRSSVLFLPAVLRATHEHLHDPMAGKGANWKLIDSIPVVEYQPPPLAGGAADAEQDEAEAPSCAICLGSFEAGDSTRLLPCKHQFHVGCIDHWLIVNATCPNCRQPIDSNRGPGGCSSSSGGDGSSSSNNNNRSSRTSSVRISGRSSSANTLVNSRTSSRASPSASIRSASFRTGSSSSSDRITLSGSARSSRPSNPRTSRRPVERPVRRVSDDDIGIDPGPSTRSRHVETGSSSSTAGGGRAGSAGGGLPRLLSNIGSVLVGAAELAADAAEGDERKDSEGDVESAFLHTAMAVLVVVAAAAAVVTLGDGVRSTLVCPQGVS